MAERGFQVGALLMALGVMAGAFGAHGLRGHLDARAMEIFDTALRYHLLHGLGLMVVAWAVRTFPGPWIRRGMILLGVGVLLFSGSLYVVALTGWRMPAMLAPVGGLALILGWLAVALGVGRAKR